MDGSSTGIAMCHIAVAVSNRRESVVGTQQTKWVTADLVRCQMHCRRSGSDVCFHDNFVCSWTVNGLCGQQAERYLTPARSFFRPTNCPTCTALDSDDLTTRRRERKAFGNNQKKKNSQITFNLKISTEALKSRRVRQKQSLKQGRKNQTARLILDF